MNEKPKRKRDGIWTSRGLSSDFRLIREHANDSNVFLVETAPGDYWANGKELSWDAEDGVRSLTTKIRTFMEWGNT